MAKVIAHMRRPGRYKVREHIIMTGCGFRRAHYRSARILTAAKNPIASSNPHVSGPTTTRCGPEA